MVRKAFLRRLEEEGIPIQPYRLNYLLQTNQLTRPELDAGGQFIYTEAHVDEVAALERAPRQGRRCGPVQAPPTPFLLHLVDVVWGVAHEDESVPSTEWAHRMIAKARETFDHEEGR